MVTNYRHSSGIKNIFAGADGARLIFIDDHNQGYVYSAVSIFFCFIDFYL